MLSIRIDTFSTTTSNCPSLQVIRKGVSIGDLMDTVRLLDTLV